MKLLSVWSFGVQCVSVIARSPMGCLGLFACSDCELVELWRLSLLPLEGCVVRRVFVFFPLEAFSVPMKGKSSRFFGGESLGDEGGVFQYLVGESSSSSSLPGGTCT